MAEENLLDKIKIMSPDEKKELVKKIGDTAYNSEMTVGGCSSGALDGLMEHFGIDDPNLSIYKSSTGLSGGVGRCAEVCGALIGAVMVIGMVYGREKHEPPSLSPEYQETMRRSGMLCDRFTEEFGSMRCNDVQKKMYGKTWNMRDPVVYQEDFRPTLNADNKCAYVTKRAAELAAEVILESE